MNLDQYLQSDLAQQDVQGLLAIPAEQTEGPTEAVYFADWTRSKEGAWVYVNMDGLVGVYYRPDGDRFIVTDLGEAVRAFRLRTGCSAQLDGELIERLQANTDPRDWLLWPDGVVGRVLATAADLPRAIVRVLLAAHRVASLEAP